MLWYLNTQLALCIWKFCIPDVEGRLYCFTDGTVHLTEGTWAFWSFGICGEGRGPETNLPWILRDHCTFTRLKDDGWILSSLLTSALRAQYLSSSHLGSSSTQRNVLHRVGNKLGRYLKISYLVFSLNFSMAGKNSLPFQALVPQLNCSNCWSSSHSWANICLPTGPGFAPWAQEEQILCPTAALLALERDRVPRSHTQDTSPAQNQVSTTLWSTPNIWQRGIHPSRVWRVPWTLTEATV